MTIVALIAAASAQIVTPAIAPNDPDRFLDDLSRAAEEAVDVEPDVLMPWLGPEQIVELRKIKNCHWVASFASSDAARLVDWTGCSGTGHSMELRVESGQIQQVWFDGRLLWSARAAT